MRKMRKIAISLLLVMVLVLPVLAAGNVNASLTADKTTVGYGDEITLTVSAQAESVKSGGVEVFFDSSFFEIVSGACVLQGTLLADFDVSACDGVFVFSDAAAVDGAVFQFVLKVKEDAPLTSSEVTVDVTVNNSTVNESIVINMACDHAYDNGCDKSCNLCGATRKINHTYDDGKVTTESTCTGEGVKTFTCTVCGETKTEAVAKKEHSYDDGKVTTEATCTAEGVKTFTCTGCGKTKTATVDSKGHSYDAGKVTTEATCTEEGVKTFTCTACGKTKTETVESKGHAYDGGVVTTEASCTAEGLLTITCTVCGKTKTETIAALGHAYDHGCDTDCNTCGETRITEHNYSNLWSSDETGHWHECTACADVLELIPHTPGPEPTEEEDQICLDCGFVLQIAGTHVHAAVGDWLSDDSGHWHLCSCGEKLEDGIHAWDEGTLDEIANVITYYCTVCGHPKMEAVQPPTESVPATQPSQETQPTETEPTQASSEQPEEEFPWLMVIVIVGVLLVAAVVCIIVGILRSKKRPGKYTTE